MFREKLIGVFVISISLISFLLLRFTAESSISCKSEVDAKQHSRINSFKPKIEFKVCNEGANCSSVKSLTRSMVYVKGGTFTMGCTSKQCNECDGDEEPAHEVTLGNYSIGKYEVTQEQWEAVMGDNPSLNEKCPTCPVENVSWEDVQVFIKKLNAKTGKSFRLPTEAEWEYAARGGRKSKGYEYSGGNNPYQISWLLNHPRKSIYPVGQKLANELGLYDMSGNVWEWCQDWYVDYNSQEEQDSLGGVSMKYRVIRGGSNYGNVNFLRVSYRHFYSPNNRDDYIGFRLVLQSDSNEATLKKSIRYMTKQERRTKRANSQSLKLLLKSMVFVKGGTFMMGCNSEQGSICKDDEKPIHQVTLSNYQINKYEVTQTQWEAVMGCNPSFHKNCPSCPVENVSWEEVQDFISKLNLMTGKSFRLPTEAEWEYAARGGNANLGIKYSIGNYTIGEEFYSEKFIICTRPVGSFSPNELGLYDMSGNVLEWCQDWYGPYSAHAQHNPSGPSYGESRVSRSGCCGYGAESLRVSSRSRITLTSPCLGFRLILPSAP